MGHVKISEHIKETQSYGKPAYVLTVQVSEPSGYTEVVMERRPEACFVYRRTRPGEPLFNQFVRVCSIDDFYTLPFAASRDAGSDAGLYRTGSYVAEYTDYNSSLADQDTLRTRVSAFYNNLNAYVNSHSGTESTREYIMPDYEQSLLDGLIATYRGLALDNIRDQALVDAINGPVLQLLNANKVVYSSLQDAADTLSTHAGNKPAVLEKFNMMKTAVGGLRETMASYSYSQSRTQKAFLDIAAVSSSVRSLVTAAVSDSDDRTAILAELDDLDAKTDSSGYSVAAMSKAEIDTLHAQVLPGADRVMDLDTQDFTDTTTLTQLVTAIRNFGISIDSAIASKRAQADELSAMIESRKGEMQSLLARMKQIRPSIDTVNPDSVWYFTLNITR